MSKLTAADYKKLINATIDYDSIDKTVLSDN